MFTYWMGKSLHHVKEFKLTVVRLHFSTCSKSFFPIKKCKEYVYKGTKAGRRLVKAQHMVKIFIYWKCTIENSNIFYSGNGLFHVYTSFCNIRTCFKIFLGKPVLISQEWRNDKPWTSKSLMLNPLYAIKLSPNWSVSTITQVSVI